MTKKLFLCDTVDEEKCKGCTNCVKICPTEAIRVRKGKSLTIEERCINCGNCIKICPYHAKIAKTDPLDIDRLKEFKYTIALCSPVLYSQFHRILPPGKVLNAVKSLGFDDVCQESIGAEAVAIGVKELLKTSKVLKKPVISTACPAVVRLIQLRFPSLLVNTAPFLSPQEIAAKLIREQVSQEKNIPKDQIGIFMITPCTAKVTEINRPLGIKKSFIDGALSLLQLYGKILPLLSSIPEDPSLAKASGSAIGWARSGGESRAIQASDYLVVDGLNNLLKLFEAIEMGHFQNVDYIECLVCNGGCVGGPLTAENPYMARIMIRKLIKALPQFPAEETVQKMKDYYYRGYFHFDEQIEPNPILPLNRDISKAIEMASHAEKILGDLPGIDCGSCGSPNCRALAEDIAQGYASITDCIFRLLQDIYESSRKTSKLLEKDRRICLKGKEGKD